MSTPTTPTRAPSVEAISRETFQASINNARLDSFPVEPTHFPLPISDFARRLQSPIDELQRTLLINLLADQALVIPMITHSEPSSPLLSLYLAYREISWFVHLNREPHAYPAGVINNQEHVLSALHQLGALKVLAEIQLLPRRYISGNNPRRVFCTQCYHLGHLKRSCPHIKCTYCHQWAPGHYPANCPLLRAHQRRRNNPATARDPFHSPENPSVSPHARRHSSASSSSSRRSGRRNPQGKGRMSPPPRPIPRRRNDTPRPSHDQIDQFIDDAVEEADDYDDSAIANMTGEPYGDL